MRLSLLRVLATANQVIFQVANYGVGGQYGGHWDAFDFHNTNEGEFGMLMRVRSVALLARATVSTHLILQEIRKSKRWVIE